MPAVDLPLVLITCLIVGLLVWFGWIQHRKQLDFTDMITMDGHKVSMTKVLQLIGGLAATWIVIDNGLKGTLSEGVFGIYLVFIGGVATFAKFMAAKYNYVETSLEEAQAEPVQAPSRVTSTERALAIKDAVKRGAGKTR